MSTTPSKLDKVALNTAPPTLPRAAAVKATDDDTVEEINQARLMSVTLPTASHHAGLALGLLALPSIGVTVVSVRRANGAVLQAAEQLLLGAGDTLVLSGLPEALALAEERLLQS